MMRRLLLLLFVPALAAAQPATVAPDGAKRVDAIFARWTQPESPGCAVGVSRDGAAVLTRAYGLANLEFDVPLTPGSVFESGSVAKQFTAAAIGLLVLDGKLAVTDPARKYVPELPEFAAGVTIQHLLTHTSGLRSQWPLLTIAGRPPGEAVHTVDEILDLVSRQRRLNFEPGEHYLYNNTAFTLLSVIVSRVSGKPFQAFCDERLFRPLGMASTQWRVDHRQVVKGRATAYRQSRDKRFQTFMSITDVVGNGGLLTTVDDLLRWNANLDDPNVGGRALVDWLETRGRLNDGTENEYARGLTVTTYKGVREVSHGGSTAGYQTFLARFPDARLSVAVLCNTTGTNPSALAHQVADVFLGEHLREPTPAAAVDLPDTVLKERAGLYRDQASGALLEIAVAADGLHAYGATGPKLLALDANRFVTSGRATYTFEPVTDGGSRTWRVIESSGNTRPTAWHRVEPAVPGSESLGAYAGRYWSAELEVAYTVEVEHGKLWLRFRGDAPREMTPADRDGFVAGNNVVRFTRGAAGEVDGFTVYAGRVWHLRFDRVTP
jgi:CubicO group peptidase (beta-lactamase class C family)